MLSKIKSWLVANPLLAAVILLALGGVIALAFPVIAGWLRPVARKVPGSQAA